MYRGREKKSNLYAKQIPPFYFVIHFYEIKYFGGNRRTLLSVAIRIIPDIRGCGPSLYPGIKTGVFSETI